MLKKILKGFLALILILVTYLLLWPVPIDPVDWTPPENPGLTGVYQANDALANTERLFDGECHECEDVLVDSNYIYGGDVHGDILKFDRKTKKRTIVASLKGRPLGLKFDSLGNIIVLAGGNGGGLHRVAMDGKVEDLVTEFDGKPFGLADDLDIAADGTIYFTDATDKFGFEDNSYDIMEQRANGALYAYYPATGETKRLLDDMYFANGVALSEDEAYVLVNETSKFRVRRYWLKGKKKGTNDIFIDNLPAFPDGILRDEKGVFWISMISPRTQQLDDLLGNSFMKKVFLRLPKSMHPAPEPFCFALGVDENAKVIHNLQDTKAKFTSITNIVAFDGKLYFGTLVDNAIGRADYPK